jgi:SagB-type dehydrogenase family enzyme
VHVKKSKIVVSVWLCLIVGVSFVFAAEQVKVVTLPAPRTDGGMPLMQALKERKSARDYSQKELSIQMLSDLLWAGFGITRADGRRTAPSAANVQEIEIYIAKADGLFRYNAQENALELVIADDIRGVTGSQPFVKSAPINLIYVADYSKKGRFGTQKDSWAAMDTGFIAENVYLFCASEGLATVARGLFDPEKLSQAMKLRADQKIILTQSIGYPKNS